MLLELTQKGQDAHQAVGHLTDGTMVVVEHANNKVGQIVEIEFIRSLQTAAGKMMFRMLAVLAEFERDQISERTSTAMKFKAAKGERVGKVPFGFDLSDDGVTLVPNESEQRALILIRELRAMGESLRKIAAELERQKFPTKEGKPWTHSTVQRIVSRAA